MQYPEILQELRTQQATVNALLLEQANLRNTTGQHTRNVSMLATALLAAEEENKQSIEQLIQNINTTNLHIDQCDEMIGRLMNQFNASALQTLSVEEQEAQTQATLEALSIKLKLYFQSDDFCLIPRALPGSAPFDIRKNISHLKVVSQEEQQRAEQGIQNSTDEGRTPRVYAYDAIRGAKEDIAKEDLFNPDMHKVSGKRPEKLERVLAIGRAGVGKSTLLRDLAHRWNKGEILQEFSKVFHVSLREIAHDYGVEVRPPTIEKILYKHWAQYQDLSEQQWEKLWPEIKQREKVLFLLDGYDETPSDHRTIAFLLKNLKHYIVSSRPYNLPTDIISPDSMVEVMGYTGEDIKDYIARYFSESEAVRSRGDSLQRYLDSNSEIKAFAYIPINLELLCMLWNSGDAQKELGDNPTLTVLYENFLELRLRTYIKHEKSSGSESQKRRFATVNLKNLRSKDVRKYCKGEMNFLSLLALKALQSEKLVIAIGGKSIGYYKKLKLHF